MRGTKITVDFTTPAVFGEDEAGRENYQAFVASVAGSYGAHDVTVTIGDEADWGIDTPAAETDAAATADALA